MIETIPQLESLHRRMSDQQRRRSGYYSIGNTLDIKAVGEAIESLKTFDAMLLESRSWPR